VILTLICVHLSRVRNYDIFVTPLVRRFCFRYLNWRWVDCFHFFDLFWWASSLDSISFRHTFLWSQGLFLSWLGLSFDCIFFNF